MTEQSEVYFYLIPPCDLNIQLNGPVDFQAWLYDDDDYEMVTKLHVKSSVID